MTTYIFSEKLDKSKIALENVKKYNKDRKIIVDAYLKAIFIELDNKITSVSRNLGLNTVNFNYATVPFTFKTEKDEIIFNDLKTDEHEYILENIKKYLIKEGFKYELPQSIYNSKYFKSSIIISWSAEDFNLTPVGEYVSNVL